MKNLIIFPYNGNGLEALDCIGDEFEVVGFIDDQIEKQGKQSDGFVVFPRNILEKENDLFVIAVPGSPTSFLQRRKVIENLRIRENRFATIIHPSARISRRAKIGKNVLIMAGVVITGNAVIGDHVCVLPNTVIHHDSIVGDYSLIGSNVTVAGYVKMGQNCYVGSGTSIINGIEIGEQVLVGLGSNVIRSIPACSKVAGNPARILGNLEAKNFC